MRIKKNQPAMPTKLTLVLSILSLVATLGYAGDDICTATFLPTSDQVVSFDNSFNSSSAVAIPPFGGYAGPDTWIEFVMPASGNVYLLINGLSMTDPAIAIYEGPCTDPTLLYNVLDNNCNGGPSPELTIDQLTAGESYFLRIWPENGSTNGEFGIILTETLPSLPDFIAFADATITGDCIQLTSQANVQQGCAWYQIPIDFSMPFTHNMTANFGTIDANGADGICLVYQSNGQDFCGGTGEGIGAGGMPNSAIFEFDTWENGNLNDPAQDHCAFNINGEMNHLFSIDGPVVLGNIEDGADHTISFEWNPVGNSYALYFDGVLQLSGSFDIIGNCFGGSTTAFWGYTSATGGANNLHVICPEVNTFEPATVSYEVVSICDGDSYNGNSTEGYYTDFSPIGGGCNHQTNYLLGVYDIPEPAFVDTLICAGEFVFIEGNPYTGPALYTVAATSFHGCDSTINLTVDVLEASVEILAPPILSCIQQSVDLESIINVNLPVDNISYLWSVPNVGNVSNIQVSAAGQYSVTAFFQIDNLYCEQSATVTVMEEISPPIIDAIPDISLDCSNINGITQINNPNINPDAIYQWSLGNEVISTESNVDIQGAGNYVLMVTNPNNGCSSMDTVIVALDDDIPIINVAPDTLNCEVTSFMPNITVSDNVVSYTWSVDGDSIANTPTIEIAESGNYAVTVTSANGCTSTASVQIITDTIAPTILLFDANVPCDSNSIIIPSLLDSSLVYHQISGPQNLELGNDSFLISAMGSYVVEATDPSNQCTARDTFEVTSSGPSPQVELSGDTIDCITPSIEIQLASDQQNLSYNWSGMLPAAEIVTVSNAGWYVVTTTNANGCYQIDSIHIFEDTVPPDIELSADTLTCLDLEVTATATVAAGHLVSWTDGMGDPTEGLSINIAEVGTIYASVVDPNNGCITLDSIEIISTAVFPSFTVNDDTITCEKPSVELDFQIANTYESLSWTGPSNFMSTEATPEITEGGIYTVIVVMNDDCQVQAEISIMEDTESPILQIVHDTITCLQPTADIVLASDIGSTITTTFPDGQTTDQALYSSDQTGIHTVVATALNGCSTERTFTINAFTDTPTLQLSADGEITCADSVVQISSIADAGVSYQWTGAEIEGLQASTVEVTDSGEYTLQIVNQYGCTNEGSIFIAAFLDAPTLTLTGQDLSCHNQTAMLTASSTSADTEITWLLPSGSYDSTSELQVDQEGLYICTAINGYGCTSEDSIIVTNYSSNLHAELLSEALITVDHNNPMEHQILLVVNTANDYEIAWTPAEAVSCDDCPDPYLIIANEIEELTATIVDEYGCGTQLTIFINYEREVIVTIPNIFSPGSNSGNAFFTLYGNQQVAEILSMDIYDRWGNHVASTVHQPPNEPLLGWDGRFGDSDAVAGVYVYIFKVLTVEGRELFYSGDVTLLR